MRISDWSSDVCSSDLIRGEIDYPFAPPALSDAERDAGYILMCLARAKTDLTIALHQPAQLDDLRPRQLPVRAAHKARSEEHTSELQSLMRISYAVFCLKKKNRHTYRKEEPQSKHH